MYVYLGGVRDQSNEVVGPHGLRLSGVRTKTRNRHTVEALINKIKQDTSKIVEAIKERKQKDSSNASVKQRGREISVGMSEEAFKKLADAAAEAIVVGELEAGGQQFYYLYDNACNKPLNSWKKFDVMKHVKSNEHLAYTSERSK